MHRITAVAIGMLLAVVAGGARADVVTDWNVAALQLTQAVDAPGGVQSRALTMMHVAMSDAINTVQNRYTRLVVTEPLAPNVSAEAAAASAARQVLIQLFPKHKEMIEKAYTASVKAIPDGPAKTQGVALGERAASAVHRRPCD